MRTCEDCKKDMGAGENRKTCTKCGKACCTHCLTKHDTPHASAKRRDRTSVVDNIEKGWDGWNPPLLDNAKADIDKLVAVIRRMEKEAKVSKKRVTHLEKELVDITEASLFIQAEVERLQTEKPRAKLGTARAAMYEVLHTIKETLERTKDEELK